MANSEKVQELVWIGKRLVGVVEFTPGGNDASAIDVSGKIIPSGKSVYSAISAVINKKM